jgi:hypothetical protein
LVGKYEAAILFGRNRIIICNNIKIYLKEMGWKFVDWVNLIQAREKWRAFVNRLTSREVP